MTRRRRPVRQAVSAQVLVPLLVVALVVGCASADRGSPDPVMSDPDPPLGRLDLQTLIEEHRDRLGPIAQDPERYRLQILLGQVLAPSEDRGPSLLQSGFRVDAEYFYPASAIKLAGVVGAIELLNELDDMEGGTAEVPLVGLDTPLRYFPLFPGDRVEDVDDSHVANGTITVAHEIRKLFLVSDNRAFNRLYELVGFEDLNQRMWDLGLSSTRIQHRTSRFLSVADQKRTPRVELLLTDQDPIVIPKRTGTLPLDNSGVDGIEVGRGHMEGDELVEEPFSFLHKNRISLRDLQELLVMVVRPDVVLGDGRQPLRWSEAQREFVWQAMSESPGDSKDPIYPADEYPANYADFLLDGLADAVPRGDLAVFDKTGWAYGFMVENAYVVDQRTGRHFFITATVYVNSDGILNDDRYEYEEVGRPFFEELAALLAERLLAE